MQSFVSKSFYVFAKGGCRSYGPHWQKIIQGMLVMSDTLFLLYIINATLLITHEIDSAYWREWELFRLPGGAGGFVLIHLPLVALILYGLALLAQGRPGGLLFSLLLSLCGFLAIGLHGYFLKTGHPEFDTPVSKGILATTGLVSLIQCVLTVYLWI
jgi:hypothetical protein